MSFQPHKPAQPHPKFAKNIEKRGWAEVGQVGQDWHAWYRAQLYLLRWKYHRQSTTPEYRREYQRLRYRYKRALELHTP